MGLHKFSVWFFVAVLFKTAISQFPNELPRCRAGDNDCLPKVITEVLRKFRNGNEALNLPPFDPLFIPEVNIIQKNKDASNIQVELYFKDCKLYGISEASVNKTSGFEKDPANKKFEVHARVPRIILDAFYKVEGKVLILPITGSGRSNLTLDNVDIKIKFVPNVTEKNGRKILNIDNNKFKLAFDTTRLYLSLENLFGGNKALGDNMNLFLNENWKIILTELKPAVKSALSEILTNIINSVFEKLNYNEIFLE